MNPSEEIAPLRSELDATRTENKMLRLASVLAKNHSIRESAMEDVPTRIKNNFVSENGQVVPIDESKGETPEEFVQNLSVCAPHRLRHAESSVLKPRTVFVDSPFWSPLVYSSPGFVFFFGN